MDQELLDKVQELYNRNYSKYRIQKTLGVTKKVLDQIATEAGIHFTSREEIQERNLKMLELRLPPNSWSLEAIGEIYPINGKPMTKEGVRLAIQSAIKKTKSGTDMGAIRGKSPNRVNRHTSRFDARKLESTRLYESGVSEPDIAAQLGVCEKTVGIYLKDVVSYQEKHHPKNRPAKSTLSYDEIFGLRKSGKKPIEIAALANVSLPRVLQIIQLKGDYNPSKKTVQRIKRVTAARAGKISVREIAHREGVTEGQVYRYINLASVLRDNGRL